MKCPVHCVVIKASEIGSFVPCVEGDPEQCEPDADTVGRQD